MNTSGYKYWTNINSFGTSGFWCLSGDSSTECSSNSYRWSDEANLLPTNSKFLLWPYNQNLCGSNSVEINVYGDPTNITTNTLNDENIWIYRLTLRSGDGIEVTARNIQSTSIALYTLSDNSRHEYIYQGQINETSSRRMLMPITNSDPWTNTYDCSQTNLASQVDVESESVFLVIEPTGNSASTSLNIVSYHIKDEFEYYALLFLGMVFFTIFCCAACILTILYNIWKHYRIKRGRVRIIRDDEGAGDNNENGEVNDQLSENLQDNQIMISANQEGSKSRYEEESHENQEYASMVRHRPDGLSLQNLPLSKTVQHADNRILLDSSNGAHRLPFESQEEKPIVKPAVKPPKSRIFVEPNTVPYADHFVLSPNEIMRQVQINNETNENELYDPNSDNNYESERQIPNLNYVHENIQEEIKKENEDSEDDYGMKHVTKNSKFKSIINCLYKAGVLGFWGFGVLGFRA